MVNCSEHLKLYNSVEEKSYFINLTSLSFVHCADIIEISFNVNTLNV